MFKKILLSVLSVILVFSVISCNRRESYSDGIECKELTDSRKISNARFEEYSEYDEEYVKYFFDGGKYHDDFSIIYTTDTNDIDEIGVFHAPDESSLEELFDDVKEYIEEMQEEERAFIASYAAAELPKLDHAEVRKIGHYVVYVVGDSSLRDNAFSAVEEKLKK